MEEKSFVEEFVRSPVRPLVTVLLVGTMCYLFISAALEPKDLMAPVMLVLYWWFEERKQQHREQAIKENNGLSPVP